MSSTLTLTHTRASRSGLRPVDPKAVQEGIALFFSLKAKYSNFTVVEKLDARLCACNVRSERQPISTVVVSLPTYLDWDTECPINELEKANNKNLPDRHKAVLQHGFFIERMLEMGIEVLALPPSPERLEGVYTRDIAFVVGGQLIQANFTPFINDKASPRLAEEHTVFGGLKTPPDVIIEGGNVVVDDEQVFVGIGDRTNEAALGWLQAVLGSSKQVVGLHLKPGVLHLDCVFLPIIPANGAPSRALIHEPAFIKPAELSFVERLYGRIQKVHPSEVPLLGLNAPCVDTHTRLVSQHAKKVISAFEEWGLKVVTVDMGEIIKAEGGPRCSTMPLVQA